MTNDATWTAIVPLKPPGQRKTRLFAYLSPQERELLAEFLFAHVVSQLRAVPAISDIALLSTARAGWAGLWVQDEGRGLNEELRAARSRLKAEHVLVLHGDLPLLAPADVEALLDAAQGGCALAPDRHASGTNAIALGGMVDFAFAFGPDSLAAHQRAAENRAKLVRRIGLELDIDTPDDLQVARAAGFTW